MPDSNAELIGRFVAYLRAERCADQNTVSSYEKDVRKFGEWLGKSLTTAKRVHMQKYISDLLGAGVSARTASHRLSCLRHFYLFLIDEGEVQTDPARNLPVPKTWKTVPKSLSLADLDKMTPRLGILP